MGASIDLEDRRRLHLTGVDRAVVPSEDDLDRAMRAQPHVGFAPEGDRVEDLQAVTAQQAHPDLPTVRGESHLLRRRPGVDRADLVVQQTGRIEPPLQRTVTVQVQFLGQRVVAGPCQRQPQVTTGHRPRERRSLDGGPTVLPGDAQLGTRRITGHPQPVRCRGDSRDLAPRRDLVPRRRRRDGRRSIVRPRANAEVDLPGRGEHSRRDDACRGDGRDGPLTDTWHGHRLDAHPLRNDAHPSR